MKVRTIVLALAGLVAACGAGAWWFTRGEAQTTWRLAEVTRGDVRATVSATGTLDSVSTVEVGTQVSGIIEALLVDFNDPVTTGQVIARIDTSLLASDVESARANVAVRKAELDQATLELGRVERLHAVTAVTDAELETARTEREVAEAQLRSARISLSRAERNLQYATITSPIDGTVVERDVEVGQTVNAGMSAPRLFLIAGDLARMEILASVDEADIGRIAEGQDVEFTVQAYADDTFHGTVRQVRLQSTTVENVVTYTVVVDVDNTDGRLLPGMTATADFVVEQATDVLCVPNSALRFRPDDGQVVGAGTEGAGTEGTGTEGAGTEGARATGKSGKGDWGKNGRRGGRRGSDGKGRLWLPEGDRVRALPVETGLAGGDCTVVSGDGVTEGLQVVSGIERSEEKGGATSPFQQQQQTSRWRRPGGF